MGLYFQKAGNAFPAAVSNITHDETATRTSSASRFLRLDRPHIVTRTRISRRRSNIFRAMKFPLICYGGVHRAGVSHSSYGMAILRRLKSKKTQQAILPEATSSKDENTLQVQRLTNWTLWVHYGRLANGRAKLSARKG
jgi:hypothetical protein